MVVSTGTQHHAAHLGASRPHRTLDAARCCATRRLLPPPPPPPRAAAVGAAAASAWRCCLSNWSLSLRMMASASCARAWRVKAALYHCVAQSPEAKGATETVAVRFLVGWLRG